MSTHVLGDKISRQSLITFLAFDESVVVSLIFSSILILDFQVDHKVLASFCCGILREDIASQTRMIYLIMFVSAYLDQ